MKNNKRWINPICLDLNKIYQTSGITYTTNTKPVKLHLFTGICSHYVKLHFDNLFCGLYIEESHIRLLDANGVNRNLWYVPKRYLPSVNQHNVYNLVMWVDLWDKLYWL